MEALLEGLNDAQKSAVTSPASILQVLAPPGSGKTKTLTARVAYLINHDRLQPWNIIVCTFTIKAAREMKARIRGFVGDGIESKLILGTFHSVARRFLVRYGQFIDIEKNFGIADTSDSKAIIKRIIQRHSYSVDPSSTRSRISGLKAKGTTAEEFAATSKKAEHHEFACVYMEYEDTLKASNLLDYDDLLLRCSDLLRKHPECVSSIQAVLIDEYQDTNHVQYDLMTLMAQQRQKITIVGDPDQSIYGFRSAEIKNLHRMRQQYPETLVINLENNYRSSGCILSSAMAIIEQDESRPNKRLLATHCVGEQPVLRHLATANVEARWIVEEIHRSKTLSAGLLSYIDYAILLRSAALSLSIERALGNAGIPYRMVGGHRFFDRVEIKIVLDYLRVINQPNHNDALVRVVNIPARGVGDITIKGLLEEAETRKVTFWSLLLDCAQGRKKPRTKISTQAQKGIDTFVSLILTSRKKLLHSEDEGCNLLDLIGHVLQKMQFEAYLKKSHPESFKERWANVEELVAQATQMAAKGSTDDGRPDDAVPIVDGVEQREDTAEDILSRFLANVALSTEVERPDGEEPDQVTISTIHAAKGLEWPVVFIPALYDGSIPHSRAEDTDEERRLLYVGMTRAQALLYLSCPVKHSSQESTSLSRFVSSRSVQKFFTPKGPAFGEPVIQDLTMILRRPCPTAPAVLDARGRLERIDDDKYPLNREEIDGEQEQWGASDPRSNGAYPSQGTKKRRKIASADTTATSKAATTMQNTDSFSVSSTTVQAGFVTASTHAKILQEAKEIARLAETLEGSKKGQMRKEARVALGAKQTSVAKKRPAGQGSITNFFARSAITPFAEPELSMSRTATFSSTSSFAGPSALNDISNVQHQPPFASRPYQLSSVLGRKPRSAPMTSKPRKPEHDVEVEGKRYVLLSSSPAKAEDPATTGDGSFSEEDQEGGPDSPSRAPALISNTLQNSSFRAASTLHTTSMAQLQAQDGGNQRKTLGMRRSVQGWSVKHQQPPRPR